MRNKLKVDLDRIGFTLIELLVIFGVIIILSGIGFASFVSYSRKQAVEQAAQKLKLAIEKMKYRANSRVKPQICEDVGFPLYSWLIRICPGSMCPESSTNKYYEEGVFCSPNKYVFSENYLPYNITYDELNSTCVTLEFHLAEGKFFHRPLWPYDPLDPPPPVLLPCQIVIQGYGVQRKICVDSSGNATVVDPSVLCS